MTWRLPAAILAACAACAPAERPGLAFPLVSAEVEPGAAAGVSGETRFAVGAARDGVAAAADCTVEGAGFRATFAAPATLSVPSFGPQSGALRVACAGGGRRGAATLAPAVRQTAGYGGVYPTIGVGIGSGGAAGVSIGGFWGGGTWGPQGAFDVRYPDVVIALQ